VQVAQVDLQLVGVPLGQDPRDPGSGQGVGGGVVRAVEADVEGLARRGESPLALAVAVELLPDDEGVDDERLGQVQVDAVAGQLAVEDGGVEGGVERDQGYAVGDGALQLVADLSEGGGGVLAVLAGLLVGDAVHGGGAVADRDLGGDEPGG